MDMSVRKRLSDLGEIFLDLVARSDGGANMERGNPGRCVCVCVCMCVWGHDREEAFQLGLVEFEVPLGPPGGGLISGLKLRRER